MKRRVFAIDYTLKGLDGEILDSSDGQSPLTFLENSEQILPALESKIKFMAVGQKATVNLKAEEAYGPYEEKLILHIPKAELSHIPNLKQDAFLRLDKGDQGHVVRVAHVGDEVIKLDGNHPMAGKDLEFTIEVINIREATQNEIDHGHAHGIDGLAHH